MKLGNIKISNINLCKVPYESKIMKSYHLCMSNMSLIVSFKNGGNIAMSLYLHISIMIAFVYLHANFLAIWEQCERFKPALLCDAEHIKVGPCIQKLHVSHFITMTMVYGSHVPCCFIDCFLAQVFQKTFCIFKLFISLMVHNQNINKRTWPSLTIIMLMK